MLIVLYDGVDALYPWILLRLLQVLDLEVIFDQIRGQIIISKRLAMASGLRHLTKFRLNSHRNL